ncbi:MAG: type 4a pilus biogenesis protein PilO [Candidatus Endonucleobacter bathymodioli]|uniref:Type 4a pilus biogenesis protein PilO n=1 Tax=Candidatus Endonucleibacter bathymodioli TaxID=539814 RepID=A0AA90NKK6_9GAMM|nr:type 4a pilus biogenesis protein PilO [Candidatus Endonucleobacter bathymodioli]
MFSLDFVDQLKNIDFNNIEMDNIGEWPKIFMIVVCVVSFFVVLMVGYQFHLSDLQVNYKAMLVKESVLREQYQLKSSDVVNLDAYKEQLASIESHFKTLLKQLPGETAVPGLLDDITYAARGAGLQVEHIQLQSEVVKEYYVELPISIVATGSYHDFGVFISSAAALPRIVTLHDFAIKSSGKGNLVMSIMAKTYRYNDNEEVGL